MNLDLYQIIADKSRIEIILDFLPYPFVISELRDGIYYNIYTNRRFSEEIGYSLDEISNVDEWFLRAYPDPMYRQGVVAGWNQRLEEAARNGDDAVMMKVQIHTKWGKDHWYEVKSSVSGPLQLIAFVSIGEMINKERELERLNENKNRTLSILAHDVRGPLTNFHSMTKLMLDGNLSSTEFMDKIGLIYHRSAQVLDFIETTLLWTKANFNSIQVRLEEVVIREHLMKVIRMYENVYQAKQIRLDVNINGETHHTDKEILTILFRNILSNAIKFTPQTGSIEISAKENGKYLMLSVKDSGVGMTQEMIDRIHMENYLSTPGTHQEKGLGLGLKLCRHLVRKINGKFEITSAPGKGTQITMLI